MPVDNPLRPFRWPVKRTKLNAWLLTWEGTSGPAVDPQRKVIAILDARRSEAFVEDLADVIYCRSFDSAYDMAFMANKRGQRSRQYRHLNTWPSQILYGRMPCIFARRVEDLTVSIDEVENVEHLHWTEPPVFGNAETGSGITELVPAREGENVRSIEPLSRDAQASPSVEASPNGGPQRPLSAVAHHALAGLAPLPDTTASPRPLRSGPPFK